MHTKAMQQEELWGEAGSSQCFSFGTFFFGPTQTEQTIVTICWFMIFEILTGAWPLAVTLAVFSSNIFRLGKVKRTLATSLTEVVAATYFAVGWTRKNCLELIWLTFLKHYLIDAGFFFRILRKFTFCTQHSDTPGLPCLLPLQLPWSLSKAKNILGEHLEFVLN